MPLEDVGFTDLYTFTRTETAEFLGSSGLIESVAANLPAVAWSAAGTALGIVLNGPVTQLLANTGSPHAVFANPFAVAETANAGVAPDGTTTASRVTEDGTTGTHYFGHNAGFPLTAGDLATWSFFVKPNGRTKIQLTLFNFSALTNWVRSTIDLSAGTAAGTVGGVGELLSAPAPEAYPNGWWRVSLTGAPEPGAAGDMYPRISLLDAAGAGNYTGDTISGVYHWGHNLAADPVVRSFVATTTAPKTRGADLMSLNNLESTFGATRGTFYQKFWIASAAPAAANRTLLHADDGTTDNSYDLRVDAGTTNVTLVARTGGSQVASITAGAANLGAWNTVAFSYVNDAFRISLNGATAVSDTAGSAPAGITAIYFGASDGAGANPLDGLLRQNDRRKSALNAVDLATLTAT